MKPKALEQNRENYSYQIIIRLFIQKTSFLFSFKYFLDQIWDCIAFRYEVDDSIFKSLPETKQKT